MYCSQYSNHIPVFADTDCDDRDLRAQLEVAVADVIELTSEPEAPVDSDYMSDSEGGTTVQCNGKLATVVRKKLAVSIQNLMQHGLMSVSLSLVCFSLLIPSTTAHSTTFPIIFSPSFTALYTSLCSLYNCDYRLRV